MIDDYPVRVIFVSPTGNPPPVVRQAFEAGSRFELLSASRRDFFDDTDIDAVDCAVLSTHLDDATEATFLSEFRTRYPTLPLVLLLETPSQISEDILQQAEVDDFIPNVSDASIAPLLRTRILSVLDQHRTRTELNRFRAFLERTQEIASVGGWEYHLDDGTLRWTDQVYDIHGLTRAFEPTVEDAIGFYHPESREKVETAVRTLIKDGESFELEARLITKDNQVKWVVVNGDFDHTFGDENRIHGTIRDITSLVDRQTELTSMRGTLQREHERLRSLAEILAHELRNPLTAADGQLELYRESQDDSYLDAVEQNLSRLETVIEDVLWLINEDEAVSDITMVDVSTVANAAWQLVEAPGVQLEIHPFESIPAEESLLQTVFEKLLTNAVTHGNPTGINIGPLHDEGDLTGFYVSDDGTGLEPGERNVFEIGVSTQPGSTGIGLGVVKEIVARHRWEIHVNEAPSGGARFEIHGIEPHTYNTE